MLHFDCDYMEGAHPAILKKLSEINLEQNSGYGTDLYCESARDKICAACGCPQAEVYFLVGGTQANASVISSLLRPWQGVLAADTGHISLHEAGAIEHSGHKVLTLPHTLGKISARQVADYMETFLADLNHEHMVCPGMVYISHPTEYGTLYTSAELNALHEVCRKYGLPLYLDGARLGYALAAPGTDVTLETLAQTCDVFYIGGTKVGALFGEAVVIPTPGLLPHFFTMIKQNGALLAKGWLLGVQFDTLFTDELYFSIGKHAIDLAMNLKEGFARKGYRFFLDSPTNQQFLILGNSDMNRLSHVCSFSFWEALDENHTVIRLATSWATREEDVDLLLAELQPAQKEDAELPRAERQSARKEDMDLPQADSQPARKENAELPRAERQPAQEANMDLLLAEPQPAREEAHS